jgi:hypothetical protein
MYSARAQPRPLDASEVTVAATTLQIRVNRQAKQHLLIEPLVDGTLYTVFFARAYAANVLRAK